MGEKSGRWGRGPAAMSPVNVEGGGGVGGGVGGEERWRHFDSSVNAVSFGFVATAILISMFLVMAIFERFLRHRSPPPPLLSSSPSGRRRWRGLMGGVGGGPVLQSGSQQQLQGAFAGKLDYPASPMMSVYAKGVSVLMPGQDVPTFIAHPAPPPCPPERIPWPPHHHQFSIFGGGGTSAGAGDGFTSSNSN